MTGFQLDIQLTGAVVALACAIPGVFLVLRRMALMTDAISHAMLLGIVVAFFITGDVASPVLLIGAALTGLLTVVLVEVLTGTRLVKEDAAIGLVFPALFSIAVILISRYAGNVHLDTDAVLLGELAFAPFRRLELLGVDIGPRSLWVMSVILLINVAGGLVARLRTPDPPFLLLGLWSDTVQGSGTHPSRTKVPRLHRNDTMWCCVSPA